MEVKTILFTIWTTSACNLRCKYCYEGEKEACNMSTAVADQTINFVINTMKGYPLHNIWIVFHGGEPCMNFPIIEYLVYQFRKKLPQKQITFSLTTNATLLDNNKIEFLIDNMDEISVSLDGAKSTHDCERIDSKGLGSFNKALSTALLLNNATDKIRVRMTVTPVNVSSLFSNIRFLINCGFKTIVPVVDFFDSTWHEALFDVLERQLLLTKQYLNDINVSDISVAMTNPDELQEVGYCTGAINEFHIYPNGDIYPCVYTVRQHDYICGNVKTGLDKKKISEFKKLYASKVTQCEGCSYYNGCASTRCKFLNKALTGDSFAPSPVICLTQNVCISVYRYL